MFNIVPKNAFKPWSSNGVQCFIRAKGHSSTFFRLVAKWLVLSHINFIRSLLKNKEKYSIGFVVVSKYSGKLVPLFTLKMGIVPLLGPESL